MGKPDTTTATLPAPAEEFPYTSPSWVMSIPKPIRDHLWSVWLFSECGCRLRPDAYKVRQEVLNIPEPGRRVPDPLPEIVPPRLMEVALDYCWAYRHVSTGGGDMRWTDQDLPGICAAIWAIWQAGKSMRIYVDNGDLR